jgi:hypothetical protein
MQTLMVLIVKMMLYSALFFAYYFAFLRNRRFHTFNRYYLLAAITGAHLLPFVQWPEALSFSWLFVDPIYVSSNTYNNIFIQQLPGTRPHNLLQLAVAALVCLYVLVVLIKTVRFIAGIYSINSLEKKCTVITHGTVKIYCTENSAAPFSFFNKIFWHNRIALDSAAGRQILMHEMYHIENAHTLDNILLELLGIISWFNPLQHLYKKEINAIDEYLADQHAIASSDAVDYAELLLVETIKKQQYPIITPFFSQQINRRIHMITSNHTTTKKYLTRILAFPLAFVVFVLLGAAVKQGEPAKALTKVEVEAEFPGGAPAWQKFLYKQLKYPQQAIDKEIMGTVLVSFIVEKDGSLTHLKAEEKLEGGLTEEALRMFSVCGKWTPAKNHGKIVRSFRKQPITFRLEAE